MKKRIALVLALALCLSLFVGCGGGKKADKTLTIYTWAEMFDPDVLADFEKETGIRINYVNYDAGETMLEKLETAKGGDYDLIIADDYIIEAVVAAGLAQKLDKSKISNWDNIDPIYQGQFYDPTDEYTVPYGAGVQTIVYDPARVSVPIKGYKDLWDPSFKDSLGLTSNYRVMNGVALKVLGYSYNTSNLDEINEAGQLMFELADNVRLIKDDFLNDDLVSGEVSAAILYTSQVVSAKLEKPELEVVYPEEGIGWGIMGMFIPSQAPNAEAAHEFIDYILRPEVSAKSFEYLLYYCTTKAAYDLIDPALQEFIVYHNDFDPNNTEMITFSITPEADARHAEIWTEFRNRCGQ